MSAWPRTSTFWVLFALVGCVQTHPGGLDSATRRSIPSVLRAPESDRCRALSVEEGKKTCEGARRVAQAWARRLSPGDNVCLDNGIGESQASDCGSRGSVIDTAPDRVLVEVRSARPESKWFQRVQTQIWFDEEALVDLYLAERGY